VRRRVEGGGTCSPSTARRRRRCRWSADISLADAIDDAGGRRSCHRQSVWWVAWGRPCEGTLAGKPRRCNVICSSEARHIDVPGFLPIPLRVWAIRRPSLEKVKTAGAIASYGDLPRAPSPEDAPGRPPTANTHWPTGRAGLPTRQVEDRQSSTKQTLKPHASNRAGAATLGAGGCNSPLRPNRTSRAIAK
jgi:hypothetical protein